MAGSEEVVPFDYDSVKEVADYLLTITDVRPKIGIICGSGLGDLANQVENAVEFEYSKIPKFPVSTVVGHAGKLIFGTISGKSVVCMKGRFHYYEGYSPQKITMPVRVMKLLGVEILIVTNAAGGLNQNYKTGDIMIINDHISIVGMSGIHPLIGPNDDKFGTRFPSITSAYNKEFRKLAMDTCKELDMEDYTQTGVYLHLSGPSYETAAECRMLRAWGSDAVGMSTAPEVVVAVHCGMKVLGLSLITNMVVMDIDTEDVEPNHEEVLETSKRRAQDMQQIVKKVITKMNIS
ncbi:purine nucleoside phosphorylase-like [Dysidea avara]|uniref:purine nucleoside phosphorylase-like n=1 Tax=Dysidea avara TaxID=196820 RepID=UPI0033317B6D